MAHKNDTKWDVIVLGAGAAGCMAAITAARRGARVLLLEQNDRIGKKILATGNGKCNFTNENMKVEAFRGNRRMVSNALEEFGLRDTLEFFHGIGIYPKCKNGYYYPNSQTASSVRNALEAELGRCGVEVKTGIHVSDIISPIFIKEDNSEIINNSTYEAKTNTGKAKTYIKASKTYLDKKNDRNNSRIRYINKNDQNCFQIVTAEEIFLCNRLILATGLLASPKSGSDGSAFEMIKSLGHHFTDIMPALCGFYAKGLDFKKVAGVRTDAQVTLYIEGEAAFLDSDGNMISSHGLTCRKPFSQSDNSGNNNQGKYFRAASPQGDDDSGKYSRMITDMGELQLTDYGISGIPVFQISRYASSALKKGQKTEVSVDFFPSLTLEEVTEELMQRFHGLSKINKKCKKDGVVENRICKTAIQEATSKDERSSDGMKGIGNKAVISASSSAEAMNGLLNEKLNLALLKAAGIPPTAADYEIPMHKLGELCALCKDCRVTLTAPRDFEFAQVCAGGIVSEETDERTLESKLVPGLYFAGELLDVDGICGGYNLQWAWSSGYLAGHNASSGCICCEMK